MVKSGDQTLTLSGSKTSSGGTLISVGPLVASNVEARRSGDVTNDARLELNTGGALENDIGGTGTVETSGEDPLTLTTTNTYNGAALLGGGTLVASDVNLGLIHISEPTRP
ncbi:autotransporter-associated beta strand repeat-containing protein [Salmonella enterica]|uniref:autotransporter-associated beta strand repeat-containing protein n=1 Tax=Salmonella enterica TaxID=28901 RepID=UPI003F4BE5B4